MLMASHIYLALQSNARPKSDADLPQYLTGAVAPDVRYLHADLPRTVTHNGSLGRKLSGPFGMGYRHHLAVDQVFYRRCKERRGMGRLGAMNLTILAELYILRHLQKVPELGAPDPVPHLISAGVQWELLTEFVRLSNAYLQGRDIDQAISLLTGPMAERAAPYLKKWERWGGGMKAAAWAASPAVSHLFKSIRAEADALLETEFMLRETGSSTTGRG